MGFLTDARGEKSSMRLAMMLAVATGCGAVVASVVAMFYNNPFAIAMAGIGAGMVVAAQGWKAQQHKNERPGVEVFTNSNEQK